jgi:hypothetical protein
MTGLSAGLGHALAYIGPFLVLAAAAGVAVRLVTGGTAARIAVAVACAVVVFVPIAGVPFGGYIRGIFGAFSLPTLALLLSAAIGPVRGSRLLGRRDATAVLWTGAALAVMVYPSAYGFLFADFYRLGYAPGGLAVLLLLITAALYIAGRRRAALVFAVAAIAFHLRAFASPNLWDYITDLYLPLAATVALIVWPVRAALRRWLGQRPRPGHID